MAGGRRTLRRSTEESEALNIGELQADLDALRRAAEAGVGCALVRPWSSGRQTIDGVRRFADDVLGEAMALPAGHRHWAVATAEYACAQTNRPVLNRSTTDVAAKPELLSGQHAASPRTVGEQCRAQPAKREYWQAAASWESKMLPRRWSCPGLLANRWTPLCTPRSTGLVLC